MPFALHPRRLVAVAAVGVCAVAGGALVADPGRAQQAGRTYTITTLKTRGIDHLLANRGETLGRVKDICAAEYTHISNSLNGRIIKTIFFIFITKTLIGVAVEVPYDLFVSGAISWTPLVANIAFAGALAALAVAFESRVRDTPPTRLIGALIGGIVGLAIARGIESGLFWTDSGDKRIE